MKPVLSLCMIVRDEAEMLPGCLESVAGVVDDIVVMDTGSRDDTVAVAERMGARVLRREWRDDFSDARNAGLAEARGGWVLWIDADERLRPAEHAALRRGIESGAADAFLVPILNAGSEGAHTTYGHRLFRNGIGVAFAGRIHEQITSSLARAGGRISAAEFGIDHLGYNLAAARLEKKRQRNELLLRSVVSESPQDAYMRFTLAQNLLIAGRAVEAEAELEAALDLKPGGRMSKALPPDIRAAAWNNLAQCALARGDAAAALRCSGESLRLGPGQVTAHVMAYRACEALERYDESLAALQRALARLDRPDSRPGTAIEISVDRADLFRAMGHCCMKLDRAAHAREHFARALAAGGRRASTLAALARCELHLANYGAAAGLARQAVDATPDDDTLLDLLAFALLKEGRLEDALEPLTGLMKRRPGDVGVINRVAGVLVKLGRKEDAMRIFAYGKGLEQAACAGKENEISAKVS